ncbi:MAG: FtsW/RodA/SpoVE family cell cycle protein [Lentisphaeria bacterium]|nr:FtsW/RodA/SpoVE family cell cycle protein [Lentisphaeria bacterium]
MAVRGDLMRLLPPLLLCLIGILLTYGVCVPLAGAPERLYWRRQVFFVILGLGVYFVVARASLPRRWSAGMSAAACYGVFCGLLLVLVLLVGRSTGNGRRWLSVFGLTTVQPAEFAKIAGLWALAELVNSTSGLRPAEALRRHLLACVAVAVPAALIVLERSLGNAFLFCAAAGVLLVSRWLSWQTLLAGVLIAVPLLLPLGVTVHRLRHPPLAVQAEHLAEGRAGIEARERACGLSQREVGSVLAPGGSEGLFSHCPARFSCYLSREGGWNAEQASRCIQIGGYTGCGYRRGRVTILGYLPRTVQHTDFAYCVLSESLGLAGGMAALALVATILGTILWNGLRSASPAAWSFATALAVLVFLHTAIHVGMGLRLVPIIGVPFPFLSYGGSVTVSMFAGLGLLARYSAQRDGIPMAAAGKADGWPGTPDPAGARSYRQPELPPIGAAR